MTIARSTFKSTNFTISSNAAWEDDRLSGEAKWIHGYLMTKPDDWTVRNKDLQNQSGWGQDRISRGIRELEDNDYAYRLKFKDELGRFTWKTIVFETPQDKKYWVEENQDLIDRSLVGSTNKRWSAAVRSVQKIFSSHHEPISTPWISVDIETTDLVVTKSDLNTGGGDFSDEIAMKEKEPATPKHPFMARIRSCIGRSLPDNILSYVKRCSMEQLEKAVSIVEKAHKKGKLSNPIGYCVRVLNNVLEGRNPWENTKSTSHKDTGNEAQPEHRVPPDVKKCEAKQVKIGKQTCSIAPLTQSIAADAVRKMEELRRSFVELNIAFYDGNRWERWVTRSLDLKEKMICIQREYDSMYLPIEGSELWVAIDFDSSKDEEWDY